VGIEKQPQASLCIFNRWGVIIKKYDSQIPFNTWDGTNTEGQMVENATYYYVLDLKNNKKPIKGYVTLLTKLTAN
jgi:gliding motility-associated-like protein